MSSATNKDDRARRLAELEAERAALEAEINDTDCDFPIVRANGRGEPRPVGCKENTEALLAHYGITCRYNEMTKELEIKASSRDFFADTQRNESFEYVADCARKQQYPHEVAVSNLVMIGADHAYHPARDWILSAEWDGTDRLQCVYDAIVETDDFSTALKEKIVRRWMIANVALLMHGTPFESDEHRERGFLGTEGVLVLQGNQGLSKTQFFASLVPPRSKFFQDGLSLDPNNKDSVALVVSHWIVELGELDSIFRKSDVAALRAWLTKKNDDFRPPYAKSINSYPRRTGICATVNDEQFLPETGENRRYWNIAVQAVRRVKEIDIQQLWAQVYAAYRAGEQFWFDPSERQELYDSNKRFERPMPLIDMISDAIIDPYKAPPLVVVGDELKKAAATIEKLNATQIIQRVTGTMSPSAKDAGEVGKWLSVNGFKTATNKKFHVVVKKQWNAFDRTLDAA